MDPISVLCTLQAFPTPCNSASSYAVFWRTSVTDEHKISTVLVTSIPGWVLGTPFWGTKSASEPIRDSGFGEGKTLRVDGLFLPPSDADGRSPSPGEVGFSGYELGFKVLRQGRYRLMPRRRRPSR